MFFNISPEKKTFKIAETVTDFWYNEYGVGFAWKNLKIIKEISPRIKQINEGKYIESIQIKKEVGTKLSHPIFFEKTYNPDDYTSGINLTHENVIRIGDRLVASTKLDKNIDLVGDKIPQYISPETMIAREKFFREGPNKILSEQKQEQMRKFGEKHIPKIKEILFEKKADFIECMNQFGKINNKIKEHAVICDRWLSVLENTLISNDSLKKKFEYKLIQYESYGEDFTNYIIMFLDKW